jgi:hypothetical protein
VVRAGGLNKSPKLTRPRAQLAAEEHAHVRSRQKISTCRLSGCFLVICLNTTYFSRLAHARTRVMRHIAVMDCFGPSDLRGRCGDGRVS